MATNSTAQVYVRFASGMYEQFTQKFTAKLTSEEKEEYSKVISGRDKRDNLEYIHIPISTHATVHINYKNVDYVAVTWDVED